MKNQQRKFNHETAHNQLIPVQYNVMCIDRAKVKIIYSGRFKENLYRLHSQNCYYKKYMGISKIL